MASLKKQLQQLKDGTHPEYNRKLRRLEAQYKERFTYFVYKFHLKCSYCIHLLIKLFIYRLRLNIIYRDYLTEWVERDYILEKKAAVKEFEEKKIDLKENLLTDMEEKRKMIESDRHTMELTGDSMEV